MLHSLLVTVHQLTAASSAPDIFLSSVHRVCVLFTGCDQFSICKERSQKLFVAFLNPRANHLRGVRLEVCQEPWGSIKRHTALSQPADTVACSKRFVFSVCTCVLYDGYFLPSASVTDLVGKSHLLLYNAGFKCH